MSSVSDSFRKREVSELLGQMGEPSLKAIAEYNNPSVSAENVGKYDKLTFKQAFAQARRAKEKTFSWRPGTNKKNISGIYHTMTEEEMQGRQVSGVKTEDLKKKSITLNSAVDENPNAPVAYDTTNRKSVTGGQVPVSAGNFKTDNEYWARQMEVDAARRQGSTKPLEDADFSPLDIAGIAAGGAGIIGGGLYGLYKYLRGKVTKEAAEYGVSQLGKQMTRQAAKRTKILDSEDVASSASYTKGFTDSNLGEEVAGGLTNSDDAWANLGKKAIPNKPTTNPKNIEEMLDAAIKMMQQNRIPKVTKQLDPEKIIAERLVGNKKQIGDIIRNVVSGRMRKSEAVKLIAQIQKQDEFNTLLQSGAFLNQ